MNELEKDSVRKFLASAMEAKLEIARHKMRAEELESRCTKVTASMSGMPGGGGADAQALWAALADERAKEREAELRETEAYHRVEEFIDKLPNSDHRAILRLRYLSGMGWVNVQMKLYDAGIFYSERHIFRLHGEALESARELWRHMEGGDVNEVQP